MLLQILLLVLSLILLFYGAGFALEGAEKIGKILKLSPLVVGVVLIGFGTSLPEFFVSQISSYNGHPEMAIGNIIGSNIANIFLILGVSSFLTVLHLGKQEIRSQLFTHILLTILLSFVLWRGQIDYLSSFLLGSFFIFSLFKTFKDLKKDTSTLDDKDENKKEKLSLKNISELIFGFIFLYLGGELLVSSGSKIAKLFGLSEYIISVIFVAFGTSFPELVTALLACKKKKNVDLITGNIIGSNIFNVAFVLGSLGVYNFKLSKFYRSEISILLFVSLLLLLFSYWPKKLNRLIGVIFLVTYAIIIYAWL